MRSTKIVSLAVALAIAAAGCKSISDSITSPSRSISASFDSISTSSGSGGSSTPNATSYRHDLREYAAVFVRGNGTREDFLRGVSRIAEDHGITHWESEPVTPRAIGEGLRDAKLSQAEMEAFVDSVGRDRPEAQLALEGYLHPGS